MPHSYLKQTDRRVLWEKAWGPVPALHTVGSKCRVPYCKNLECMCIKPDKNAGRQNVAQYRDRLRALQAGEYIEIPVPENLEKFRASLRSGSCRLHIVTRTMPRGVLRLINNGEHCVRDNDLLRQTYRMYPQVIGRPIRQSWQPPAFEITYLRCRQKACPYPPLIEGLCKKHLAEEQWDRSPMGSTLASFDSV